MNQHLEQLDNYLRKPFVASNSTEPIHILQHLTECYLENNPVSNSEVEAIEDELSPWFECISFENSAKMFTMIYDLCEQYEKAAFQEGLKVGLHLRHDIENCNRGGSPSSCK